MYELVAAMFMSDLFGTTIHQEMDAPSFFGFDTEENNFYLLGNLSRSVQSKS